MRSLLVVQEYWYQFQEVIGVQWKVSVFNLVTNSIVILRL